jgi:3-oxoacyl-[acyl-carrier protein] reductase
MHGAAVRILREGTMDLQLAGTRVIVTGSTKGIGRAIVEAFLDEGASVALCARTAADVDQALGELRSRGTVAGGPVDAADPAALRAFIASSTEQPGRSTRGRTTSTLT